MAYTDPSLTRIYEYSARLFIIAATSPLRHFFSTIATGERGVKRRQKAAKQTNTSIQSWAKNYPPSIFVFFLFCQLVYFGSKKGRTISHHISTSCFIVIRVSFFLCVCVYGLCVCLHFLYGSWLYERYSSGTKTNDAQILRRAINKSSGAKIFPFIVILFIILCAVNGFWAWLYGYEMNLEEYSIAPHLVSLIFYVQPRNFSVHSIFMPFFSHSCMFVVYGCFSLIQTHILVEERTIQSTNKHYTLQHR